jgi:hypothetical protein
MGGAVPFDPAVDPLPEALAWHPGYTGPAVLLLAGAGDSDWSAEVAIALATAWARSGQRVVLADLHIEEPVLHERVGLPNRDGAVDLCLYGASLSRSAHAIPAAGFHLIPAGTYTADAGAVYGHPRWQKIVAGFRDARAWLLVYAPADTPHLRELADWATDAILLGTPPRRGPADPVLPTGLGVRAVVEPPGAAAAPAEERLDGVDLHQAPPPDLPGSDAYDAHTEAYAESYADEPPAPEPTPAVVTRSPVSRADPTPLRRALEEPVEEVEPRRRWWPLLLVLAAIVVIAGVAALLFSRAGNLNRASVVDAPPPVQAAVPAAAAPAPSGSPLPYTVYVTAYQFYDAARRQLEVEQGRFPQATFYISPEPEQGIVYYKVFAGSLPDTGAATRLRDQLVDTGAIDRNDVAATSSLIKYSPLSFDLGEFPSRRGAERRADSLAAQGIPAYPVPAPSNGGGRWRVYGGAFADSADAEFMRGLLAKAGLEARLVQRVGRIQER